MKCTFIILAAAAFSLLPVSCSERNSTAYTILDTPIDGQVINSGLGPPGCRKTLDSVLLVLDSVKYELCYYKFLNNERTLMIYSLWDWFERNDIMPNSIYIGHPFNPDNCP